jgi:hypothetical protein
MPSRMQKDLDLKKSEGPKKDAISEQYSFKPKIGETVTGEMFK